MPGNSGSKDGPRKQILRLFVLLTLRGPVLVFPPYSHLCSSNLVPRERILTSLLPELSAPRSSRDTSGDGEGESESETTATLVFVTRFVFFLRLCLCLAFFVSQIYPSFLHFVYPCLHVPVRVPLPSSLYCYYYYFLYKFSKTSSLIKISCYFSIYIFLPAIYIGSKQTIGMFPFFKTLP